MTDPFTPSDAQIEAIERAILSAPADCQPTIPECRGIGNLFLESGASLGRLIHGQRRGGIRTVNARYSGMSITSCAVHHDGLIYSMPKPARHIDILAKLDALGLSEVVLSGTQGFLTNLGTFVRREPARRIALSAGQVLESKLTISTRELFSEDMW